MSQFKKKLFSICEFLPLSLLKSFHSVPVISLYHHVVSDEYLPHIRNLYAYKNSSQFIKDLDWILLNFKVADPLEIANCIVYNKPINPNQFLLTFDDGFREVHDVIAPILIKKGIPAIFFINPSFIDNKELFYRCKLSLIIERIKKEPGLIAATAKFLQIHAPGFEEIKQKILEINYFNQALATELAFITGIDFDFFLNQQKPFLTTEQLFNLKTQGFIIGGHSMDHPNYSQLDIEEQINQTKKTLAYIQKYNHTEISFFAFPHDDQHIPHSFFDLVKEDHCLFFGTQNGRTEKNNHILHRINAERPDISFSGLLKAQFMYNLAFKLSGKIISRKK